MTSPKALIVDDERDIRELLSMTINRMGLDSSTAGTLLEAKQLLDQQTFDICLTDMRLPDGNGLELIQHVAKHFNRMPIAMITAYGDVQSAVNALKAGAFDFVSKPINQKHLEQLLQKAFNQPINQLHIQEDTLEHRLLIGQSLPIQQLRITLKKIARSQAPVFITGESAIYCH